MDVVYTELFLAVSFFFSRKMNIETRRKFERVDVLANAPFAWGGFTFYFLVLAANAPFGPTLEKLKWDNQPMVTGTGRRGRM